MSFKDTLRLGKKATVPAINNKARRSVSNCYENSFGVTAAKFWNLPPAKVNCLTALEPFKIALAEFHENFPDKPPLDGYTAASNKSLLEWSL